MKATPDDPRLSAYLLGELSPEDAEDIRRQVAADPALRMSLDELEKMTTFLGGTFFKEGKAELLPGQREAVLRASRDGDRTGQVIELPSMRRRWKPWLTGLGAAAAMVIAALLMSRLGSGPGRGIADGTGLMSDEIALLPMPGPSGGDGATQVAGREGSAELQARKLNDGPGEYLSKVARHWEKEPLPPAESLPTTGHLGEFSDGPESRLPVVIGRSSLRWVSGWIRENRQLPPRNAVRVEELINHAALSGGAEVGGVSLVIETMKCPWNSRSLLVGVQIEGGEEAATDFKLVFRSGAKRRVLGSFVTRADGALPVILPAKHRTLVMLELRDSGSGLGGVEIHQGEQVAMHPVPSEGSDTSDGLRHAAILAGFGLWLRDEGVDGAQLAAMLAEAVVDADPVRADDRRMIGEALKLAGGKR